MLMSEDLLFAKISEPEMTVINLDDNFRDRMGEVDGGHIEVFPAQTQDVARHRQDVD